MSVHEVVGPLTGIAVAIGELLEAFALNLVFFELSLVNRTVLPGHDALTIHAVLKEVAFVDFLALCEEVLALAVELAVDEVTFVFITIKLKGAFAGLLAFFEVT